MSAAVTVLISGSGSNLQALLDRAAQPGCPFRVTHVISDKPKAFGLERARLAGVPTTVVEKRAGESRADYDARLADAVDTAAPALVVLAGFMRIIGGRLVDDYAGRMLNIHPALLPKYKGLHTHRRCLEAGDAEHGTTVHFVTEELDGGPPILQAVLAVRPGDTVETLTTRVQAMEHRIYPLAVDWFASGRLRLDAGGDAVLDGDALTAPVRLHEDELAGAHAIDQVRGTVTPV